MQYEHEEYERLVALQLKVLNGLFDLEYAKNVTNEKTIKVVKEARYRMAFRLMDLVFLNLQEQDTIMKAITTHEPKLRVVK